MLASGMPMDTRYETRGCEEPSLYPNVLTVHLLHRPLVDVVLTAVPKVPLAEWLDGVVNAAYCDGVLVPMQRRGVRLAYVDVGAALWEVSGAEL